MGKEALLVILNKWQYKEGDAYYYHDIDLPGWGNCVVSLPLDSPTSKLFVESSEIKARSDGEGIEIRLLHIAFPDKPPIIEMLITPIDLAECQSCGKCEASSKKDEFTDQDSEIAKSLGILL